MKRASDSTPFGKHSPLFAASGSISAANRPYWPHGVSAGSKMQMDETGAARRDWIFVFQ
jgi:hypothetical protein